MAFNAAELGKRPCGFRKLQIAKKEFLEIRKNPISL